MDFLLGKIVLFALFLSLTGAILLFFSVVPLYSAKQTRNGEYMNITWEAACESNDLAVLGELGLS